MKSPLHTFLYLLVMLVPYTGKIYSQGTAEDIIHLSGISEELNAPVRIASDAQGISYVTDAFTNSISKYDASGSFLETIHAVASPISVAVNHEGQLFIGDGATGNIYKYDPSLGTNEFYSGSKYPTSMEFGPGNILYVSDSKLQQVIALDLSGNVVQTIGSGILDFPTGIALDHNNSRILVGEHGGAGTGFSPTVKVYMFDLLGNLINSFGKHGSGDGQFYRIQGLTVGKCGNIYVIDPYQARISVFDESGVFITKFGDFGMQTGQMNVPMDIVFDSQEHLLVTSMNNGDLQVFTVSDTLPCSNIKSGSAMICSGESSDIEIAFTGTAPWTFTYTIDGLNSVVVTTSDNPHVISVYEAGHYEVVELSDVNYTGSCFTGSADVIVSNIIPTAHLTGDAIICEGETAEISIDFTGSPPWSFTYTIDGENSNTVTTTNNPYIFTVSKAGHYEVTSLEGGGCVGTSFTGSAAISVNPLPTATMTDGNEQIFIDPGESADLSVELTGTPPWTFTYTVDDLNPAYISDIEDGSYILTDSKTGTYDIKEVSDALCSNTVSQGYPELLINSSLTLPTSQMFGGDLVICPGESVPISVLFTGTPPWTFAYAVDTLMTTTIFNAFTNPYVINAIYPGTYEITALSDSKYPGTDFTGSAFVTIYPLSVPNFNYTANNLEISFSNISTDADSYYWDFGDGNTSIDMNPVHSFESEGEYVISLTVGNGLCGDSTISRTINVEVVSVEPIEFEKLLKMYPNPSNGMVTIEVDNTTSSDLTVEIVGVNGSVIYASVFYSGSAVEELDLTVFSSGVYFVKIVSKEYFGIKKLILSTR